MHSLLPKSRLGSVDATSNIWYEVPIFTLGVFVVEKKLTEIEEELKYLRQRIDANDEADRKERFELSQTIKNLDVSRLREKIETNGEEDRKSYNIVGNRLDRIEKRMDGLIENLKSNFEVDRELSEELKLVEKTIKDLKTRTAKILLAALAFSLPIIGWILLGNFTRFSVNDKHIIEAILNEKDIEDKPFFGKAVVKWFRPEKAKANDLTEMTGKLKFRTTAGGIEPQYMDDVIKSLPKFVVDNIVDNKDLMDTLASSQYFDAKYVDRFLDAKYELAKSFGTDLAKKSDEYEWLKTINKKPFEVNIGRIDPKSQNTIPNCGGQRAFSERTKEVILHIPKKIVLAPSYNDQIIKYLDCKSYRGTYSKIELTLSNGTFLGNYRIVGFEEKKNIDRITVVVPPDFTTKGNVIDKRRHFEEFGLIRVIEINGASVLQDAP